MFGSLSCYGLGDKLGRIRTIAAGSILVIVGSVLLSSSFSLAQLIVGRLVLGLGFGMLTATVPVWQSESSPAEHRGALVVLEGLFASVGLAISQAIDLGLYFAQGSVSWRFPLAVPILFALIILAALPFMPDSPRWLVKMGRIEEARAVLAVLEDAPEDSPIIMEDVRKMQTSLSISETGKGDFSALLRNGQSRLLNRTLLAMFSTFSQQINGIGVIGFYTTTIFEELLGLSPITARGLSVAIYVWQVSNTLVAFYTIDRTGRRKLMMFGNLGMGTMFIIVAGTVSQADRNEACAVVAAVCVFLIATFFGIGALGINYLYGTEVAPLSHRVPIYALTSGTLWIFNFLVVEITPVGFSNLGYKFFIIFAVIDICLLFPGKRTTLSSSRSADNVI
jgi:sugar porter (SP) family MFS transporter